jgi:hypothetical protein
MGDRKENSLCKLGLRELLCRRCWEPMAEPLNGSYKERSPALDKDASFLPHPILGLGIDNYKDENKIEKPDFGENSAQNLVFFLLFSSLCRFWITFILHTFLLLGAHGGF